MADTVYNTTETQGPQVTREGREGTIEKTNTGNIGFQIIENLVDAPGRF